VIVSYFEWVQDLQSFFWGEAEVNDKLYRQLELAYQQVTQMAKKRSCTCATLRSPSASPRLPRPNKRAAFSRNVARSPCSGSESVRKLSRRSNSTLERGENLGSYVRKITLPVT